MKLGATAQAVAAVNSLVSNGESADTVLTCLQPARDWPCVTLTILGTLHAGRSSNQDVDLHDWMAADETFSSVEALHEAIAKDVEQRIATAHLRAPPSKAPVTPGCFSQPCPGKSAHGLYHTTTDSCFLYQHCLHVSCHVMQKGQILLCSF